MRKEYSISLLRLIATGLIVACHVLQAQGHWLAWHLNIGVYVFFVISGYLFGVRHIDNLLDFFIARCKRILIPYYIFILLLIVLFAVTLGIVPTWRELLKLLTGQPDRPGTGHVWFVGAIVVLYALVPYFQCVIKSLIVGNIRYDLKRVVIVVMLFSLFGCLRIGRVSPVYVLTFLGGMCIARAKEVYARNLYECALIAVSWVGLLALCSRVALEYVGVYNDLIFDYCKMLFALGFFSFFVHVLRSAEWKWLDCSDKYSYEIYLCHHIFILGPLASKVSVGSAACCICLMVFAVKFLSWLALRVLKK